MIKKLLILLSIFLFGGCSFFQSTDSLACNNNIQTLINEKQALDIGKQSMSQNDRWFDWEYSVKQLDDGTWLISANRIEGYDKNGKPKFTYGGTQLFVIDKYGKVIQKVRGR